MSDLGAVARMWADIPYETDPALAYLRGLHDGYALGRADRDAEDDQAHRAAVQAAIRIVERADRRADADRPGEHPGDYTPRRNRDQVAGVAATANPGATHLTCPVAPVAPVADKRVRRAS